MSRSEKWFAWTVAATFATAAFMAGMAYVPGMYHDADGRSWGVAMGIGFPLVLVPAFSLVLLVATEPKR